MSRPLNNRRQLISQSEADEIEQLVTEMERRVPLEVRVVLTESRGLYPFGGLRVLALLLLIVAFALHWAWVPIASWSFAALFALIFFLPSSLLAHVPFAYFFTSRRERFESMVARAERYFRESDISTTQSRNGILLFFCVPEKQFYILPDKTLAHVWPQGEWTHYAETLQQELRSSKNLPRLKDGISTILERMKRAALERLGTATPEQTERVNELPNAVVFLP